MWPSMILTKLTADGCVVKAVSQISLGLPTIFECSRHPMLQWNRVYIADTCYWPRQIRKDVEGSLFLIQRNVVPLYQIIILNKKSQREDLHAATFMYTLVACIPQGCGHSAFRLRLFFVSAENYVEDVTAGFQFEKSRPYLLYRNKRDEVRPSKQC